jgi:hypothetical protein
MRSGWNGSALLGSRVYVSSSMTAKVSPLDVFLHTRCASGLGLLILISACRHLHSKDG